MKTVPFLAFPRGERIAVVRMLLAAGIAPARVCVSRLELDGKSPSPQGFALTTVSTPDWCRTYRSTPEADWLTTFARELPRT
jgi:hypothetical protein